MALIDDEDLEIEAEQIAQEGLNELDDKYQKSIGFFAWDFFIATGKLLYKIWQKIIYIANCLTDVSNMDYDDLVNYVYQTRGLVAKTATAASGYLTVTRGSGYITEGDIFETSSEIQYKATSSQSVKLGGKFKVECLTKGEVGNVPAEAICIIPTTIKGIVAVKNEEAFTNGYDDESKQDLAERYYSDLQIPATSGNKYHYQKWALEVSGVGKAKVKPLWNGNNTVKVVILDSNGNAASDELVNSVQQYIDPYEIDVDGNKVGWGCGNGQAPIGAYCTVTTCEELVLNFSIRAKLNSSYTEDEIKAAITETLGQYIEDNNFLDETPDEGYFTLSYSKMAAYVSLADGIEDHDTDSFTINDSSENIKVLDNNETTQIPVLGEITIEEITES